MGNSQKIQLGEITQYIVEESENYRLAVEIEKSKLYIRTYVNQEHRDGYNFNRDSVGEYLKTYPSAVLDNLKVKFNKWFQELPNETLMEICFSLNKKGADDFSKLVSWFIN